MTSLQRLIEAARVLLVENARPEGLDVMKYTEAIDGVCAAVKAYDEEGPHTVSDPEQEAT